MTMRLTTKRSGKRFVFGSRSVDLKTQVGKCPNSQRLALGFVVKTAWNDDSQSSPKLHLVFSTFSFDASMPVRDFKNCLCPLINQILQRIFYH